MLSLQELHNITEKELKSELAKAKLAYNQARIQIKTKHAKNTHHMRKFKKYIAQILTILTQRELSSSEISELKSAS